MAADADASSPSSAAPDLTAAEKRRRLLEADRLERGLAGKPGAPSKTTQSDAPRSFAFDTTAAKYMTYLRLQREEAKSVDAVINFWNAQEQAFAEPGMFDLGKYSMDARAKAATPSTSSTPSSASNENSVTSKKLTPTEKTTAETQAQAKRTLQSVITPHQYDLWLQISGDNTPKWIGAASAAIGAVMLKGAEEFGGLWHRLGVRNAGRYQRIAMRFPVIAGFYSMGYAVQNAMVTNDFVIRMMTDGT